MEAPRRRHVQQVDHKAVWEAAYHRTKRATSRRHGSYRYRGEAQHVSDSDLRRMAEGDHGNRESWQTNTLAACIQLCDTPGAVLCLTKGTTACCPRCVRVSLDRGADPQVVLNNVIQYMYRVTSDVSDILTPLFQAGAVLPTRPEPWYVEWSTYRGDLSRSTLFDRAATIACLAARVKKHGRDTTDRVLSQETCAAFKKEYCAALELNSAFVPVREARRKQIWAQAMAQTGQSLGHWRTQNTVAFLTRQDMQRRAGVSEEELFQAEVERAGRQAFAHFSRQASQEASRINAINARKKAARVWVERNRKWMWFQRLSPILIITGIVLYTIHFDFHVQGDSFSLSLMVIIFQLPPVVVISQISWGYSLEDLAKLKFKESMKWNGVESGKWYLRWWYIFAALYLYIIRTEGASDQISDILRERQWIMHCNLWGCLLVFSIWLGLVLGTILERCV